MKSSSSQSRSLFFSAIILILLAAGAIWFLFMRNSPEQPSKQSTIPKEFSVTPDNLAGHSAASPPVPGSQTSEAADNVQDQAALAPSPLLPVRENIPLAGEKITNFYQYLDQQKYIQTRHLVSPSQEYFTQLIQKLLENPPVVIRETDDLYTILKNNTHFFQILGKDNILILKEILNQEQDKIEDVLAGYYLLTMLPPLSSNQALALNIPEDAMYKYACFFLNTMGGRLYLTRRDPRTRMLINFYAIRIIHQANIDGKNQYGIQLQPALNLLTAEMETGGSQLRYKESYLDTLYDLKEKYQ